jgi:hypothetical protein
MVINAHIKRLLLVLALGGVLQRSAAAADDFREFYRARTFVYGPADGSNNARLSYDRLSENGQGIWRDVDEDTPEAGYEWVEWSANREYIEFRSTTDPTLALLVTRTEYFKARIGRDWGPPRYFGQWR